MNGEDGENVERTLEEYLADVGRGLCGGEERAGGEEKECGSREHDRQIIPKIWSKVCKRVVG
jgi:hypothetical protein